MCSKGVLYKRLFQAFRGKWEWQCLKKKFRINKEVLVLFMPDSDKNINFYALKNLENYRKRKYLKSSLIITNQKIVCQLYSKMFIPKSNIIFMQTSKMEYIQTYYQLHNFYAHFKYVSFCLPEGNTCSNILKSNKLTEEELLLSSIYV